MIRGIEREINPRLHIHQEKVLVENKHSKPTESKWPRRMTSSYHDWIYRKIYSRSFVGMRSVLGVRMKNIGLTTKISWQTHKAIPHFWSTTVNDIIRIRTFEYEIHTKTEILAILVRFYYFTSILAQFSKIFIILLGNNLS